MSDIKQLMGSSLYASSLVKTLYDFQQTGILCDIVIQLYDCQLAAHSVVLAAASPKLKTMITGMNDVDSKGPVLKIVELEGYSASDAKLLLEYMYTGKIAKPESVKQLDDVMSLFDALEMTRPTLIFEENSYLQADNILESELIANSLTDDYNEIPITQGLHIKSEEIEASGEEVLMTTISSTNAENSVTPSKENKVTMAVLLELSDHLNKVRNGTQSTITFKNNVKKTRLNKKMFAPKVNYECNVCGRVFHSRGGFKTHMKGHTEGKPYKCEVCGDDFRFLKHLSRHARVFHNVHICLKCGPECKCTVEDLQADKTDSEQHPCSKCGKIFNCRKNLKQHEYIHENKLQHMCETCGKCFRLSGQLTVHMAYHATTPYQCTLCKKLFLNAKRLEEHTRRHTGERPISCNTCGQRFAARSALRQHLSKHRGVTHQCDLCGRQFSSKSYLQVHVDMHYNKRERCHKCEKCDKSFFDRNSLQKHSKIHDAIRSRPFVCSICNKTFLSKSNLLSHNRFHQNDRPFECKFCRKSFKVKMHYRRHLKIHEKNKAEQFVNDTEEVQLDGIGMHEETFEEMVIDALIHQ